ncbi:MAG: hypothetical protein N2111_02595 [Candidatus Sumerlaeaceae bacterium]|nr:hypothetical protein [Candidatus Sumerlaeaceae bacterium]
MSVISVFGVLVVVCAVSLLVFRRRPLGTVSRVVLAGVAVALVLAEPLRSGNMGTDDLVLAGLVALVLAAGIWRLHNATARPDTPK